MQYVIAFAQGNGQDFGHMRTTDRVANQPPGHPDRFGVPGHVHTFPRCGSLPPRSIQAPSRRSKATLQDRIKTQNRNRMTREIKFIESLSFVDR